MRKGLIQAATLGACVSVLAGLVAAQQQAPPAPAKQAAAKQAATKAYTTWSTMGGTADSSNYSSLKQINRSNVDKLQVAWTYDSGDTTPYVLAPIVVDRTLYGAAKNGSLVAIDAATGKELWVHQFTAPAAAGRGAAGAAAGAGRGAGAAGDADGGGGGGRGGGLTAYRGLNYWESKDRSDRRIFVQTGGFIEAIDAQTGKSVETFGNMGRVDMRTGMTRPWTGSNGTRTPGQVFENLLILGSATGEAYGSPPADIRAFDVVTGSLAWVFHTIPHPGEFGYDTWPKDAWTYSGGAAVWGEISVDEARGIAYFPVGTPKYEFWGGDRHGDTLFSASIVALDARTGKRIWHYQTIHHDVWEYEMPAAPLLLTVRVDGRVVDIVAQASKNGYLYVLNRVTGEPIWPIPERPVPPSDVPGEKLSPTQPFPTKPPPFERMKYTVDDIDTKLLTPEERARWVELISKARNEGLYTPISRDYFTVMMPGHSGGANMFSTSADPETGTAYVISIAMPAIERYFDSAAEAGRFLGSGNYGPTLGTIASGRRSEAGVAAAAAAAAAGRGVVNARGPAPDPLVVARGRTVYQQTCQACHMENLAGNGAEVPSLVGVVGRLTATGVREAVRNGRSRMPPIGAAAVSDADLNALVAFIQFGPPPAARAGGAGRAGGPPPYPAGSNAPPRQFAAYSAMPAFIKPPYSSITAYDLNTGTIKWQVPNGEAIGVDPPGNNFGIMKDHGPKAKLAVTAGGLAFQATIEKKIRAYDKDTGKVLWTHALPEGSEGSPAIYEVDGRQYIAVCVRGSYVAFALPPGT
jgi:quinoprotein glucose dehydrogenase